MSAVDPGSTDSGKGHVMGTICQPFKISALEKEHLNEKARFFFASALTRCCVFLDLVILVVVLSFVVSGYLSR